MVQFLQLLNKYFNVMMNNKSRKGLKPSFIDRHTKSLSTQTQNANQNHIGMIGNNHCKDEIKYRNIHKKFSQNRIETLDDILAITLRQSTEQAHSHNKQTKNVQSTSILNSKHMNRHYLNQDKNLKSSLHVYSSQEHTQGSSNLRKRSISQMQMTKIAHVFNLFMNQPSKDHYQLNKRHSVTQWISTAQEIEPKFPRQQNNMQMINMSKLVLWTQTKLTKTIEIIYAEIFKNGQVTESLQRHISRPFVIIGNLIKKSLMKKYKTEKLMKQNLINMIYSLEYHLSKLQENKDKMTLASKINQIHYLIMFQDFLSLKYDTEDVLFYLFSRKIFSNIKKDVQIMNQFINHDDLHQFFMMMTENDENLIYQYTNRVNQHFKRFKDISLYAFLSFMINNYKENRLNLHEHHKSNEGESQSFTINNQFKYINYQYDKQFWVLQTSTYLSYIDESKTILHQIDYCAKKLIGLLCSSLSIEYRTFIKELLVIKSTHFIQIIQKINRKTILLEIGLHDTMISQDERAVYFKALEELRNEFILLMNNMNNTCLSQKKIEKFVKRLLTNPILSSKLYQLVECFETLMQQQQKQ